jgi:hypothetical protein
MDSVIAAWMNRVASNSSMNKFVIERYFETKWYLKPKANFFSSSNPYFVCVDMNRTKDGGSEYFGGAKYYLMVGVRIEKGIPTDKRIIEFCKELSDATGLPVWCNPGGHELFHGYEKPAYL